ncbi:MAG: leucine-rich repeat domain-containing protein [Lachnospiraceae bacterium]|nr:leucine-rich repeat domain-containing protein [Lachnospiraceae bacterium]
MKKTGKFVLVFLAVLFCCIGTGVVVRADVRTRGSCGPNATYELLTDGTFTVSGTGGMTNYANVRSVPWYNVGSYIRRVVIEDGITKVGNYAFRECHQLSSVSLGSDVEVIGISAFYHCSGLKTVIFPDSLKSIGTSAFFWCPRIESITLPDNLTSIGNSAFCFCESLKGTITIPDSVTTMGTYAFENCQALEKVTIGSGLTRIENNAFSNCFSLTDVLFGNNITSIGSYAFCNAPLNNVVIDGNIEIASWSFDSCRTLILEENVQSLSVTLLHNTPIVVFKGDAPSLINGSYWPEDAFNRVVLYPSGNQTYTSNYKSNFNDRTRGGYSNTWYAYGSNLITSDSIIGSCGTSCIWALTGNTLYITGVGAMRNFSGRTAVPWYEYSSRIKEVVIDESITKIGNYAFMGCSNLEKVTIGSAVTTIGTSAFYGCASLEEVTFPASLTELKAYAFSNCSGLSELTFESETAPTIASTALNTVKAKAVHADNANWSEFGKSGFGGAIYWTDDPEEEIIGGNCGNQAAWILVDGTLTIYGQNGTRGYSKKTDVPWYEYRDQITRIVVEDGITSLGNYQFMGCENVTEVYLSNTLTFIGVNAFSTCKSLTTITIPATVRTINGYAFHKCATLTEVTFEGDRPQALAPTAFANTGVVID